MISGPEFALNVGSDGLKPWKVRTMRVFLGLRRAQVLSLFMMFWVFPTAGDDGDLPIPTWTNPSPQSVTVPPPAQRTEMAPPRHVILERPMPTNPIVDEEEEMLPVPGLDGSAPRPSIPPKVRRRHLSLGGIRHLSHGPAHMWDGCARDAIIRGGKGNRCGVDHVHPAFAKHLEYHFMNCVKAAAAAAGLPEPARAFIQHSGCYANRSKRGGRGTSLHAHARALDINGIVLQDDGGNTIGRMSSHVYQYSGKNKAMYDQFRSCWREKLPRRCAGQIGSIGIPSSRLGGNRLHIDHIHLEFPLGCG